MTGEVDRGGDGGGCECGSTSWSNGNINANFFMRRRYNLLMAKANMGH